MNLSDILLGGLWLVSVAAGIGRAFQPLQALDFAVGISSLAFIVALTWRLARKKPAASDLPELNIFSGERPGFWLRVVLLFIKHGFEQAVGYHSMVDFVRYIAAYLSLPV